MWRTYSPWTGEEITFESKELDKIFEEIYGEKVIDVKCPRCGKKKQDERKAYCDLCAKIIQIEMTPKFVSQTPIR